ncbi:MAG: DUF2784 domain-containing protein [Bacteroidales bacterium]|nr:DUF2784 domain-containing protein [Bacteroidales bacterium]
MFKILDIFFTVFHPLLILFNLTGWIWRKTRLLNLTLLLITGASWTILGIFYGFGYCPFTDWHWQVLQHLGKHNLPPSYIEFLLERFTGIDFSTFWVDRLTLFFYLLVLVLSIILNLKDRISRTS